MTGNLSKKPPTDAQSGKDGVGISHSFVRDNVLYIVLTDNRTLEVALIKGDKGDTGDKGETGASGVHFGADAPTSDDVRVWVDPSGRETLDEIMAILNSLRYTDGGVTVDLSGYLNESEAAEKLGLEYVTLRTEQDEYGTMISHADIPGITELKVGTVARVISDPFLTNGLNVNNLGKYPVTRIASGSDGYRFQIPDTGGGTPITLVFDGYGWVCTDYTKPLLEDIYGYTGEYVPVEERGSADEYEDPYWYVAMPELFDIKVGTTIHVIFPQAAASHEISVDGSPLTRIMRYGSDSSSVKYPILDMGGPMELVYDGEDWICTNFVKPEIGDIDGFTQMQSDIEYLALMMGVELP